MNEEQREEIKGYYLQIIFLFIVLIAIIIAFTFLQDLIYKTKYGISSNQKLFKKNYLLSYLFVIVSFGFLLLALRNYLKQRNKLTYLALLESIFLTIASLIRLYNIKRNQERY